MKQEWITGGDENPSYFHAFLRKRRQQNHVYRIRDSEDIWHEDPKAILKGLSSIIMRKCCVQDA